MPDEYDIEAMAAAQGRLNARPQTDRADSPLAPGMQPLGVVQGGRDGTLYVPPGLDPARPAPVLICLHGAGGTGERALKAVLPHADEHGIILVAPDSRSQTWDVLRGGYGPDVRVIDQALTRLFARQAIDAEHIGIEGFSDGASYALSLGVANGDLFGAILAFSPGFMSPPGVEGRPRIFVSHGLHDQVLPINHCSRLLVPLLQRAGYEVAYQEFDGPHTVPPEIAETAIRWWLGE